jgi:DNA mismatch endonuclease (patch repair protein)
VTSGTKRRPKDRDEIARNMSAIRSRDNRTESQLRRALHRMGFRYRKYSAGLIGRPDIVFPTEKVAVFVDGDYWHGRMVREGGFEALESYYTRKQQTYWVAKLSRNVARDDRVTAELQVLGWKVLRFWESDIKRDVAPAARRVATTVRRRRARREPRPTARSADSRSERSSVRPPGRRGADAPA